MSTNGSTTGPNRRSTIRVLQTIWQRFIRTSEATPRRILCGECVKKDQQNDDFTMAICQQALTRSEQLSAQRIDIFGTNLRRVWGQGLEYKKPLLEVQQIEPICTLCVTSHIKSRRRKTPSFGRNGS